MPSEDTVLLSDSDDQIADDEQDFRKVTISKAHGSLDAVKSFAEIHGDKQMSAMLNELIRKVKTLELQHVRQNTIHIFFKK